MKVGKTRTWAAGMVCALFSIAAVSANAVTYGFTQITANGGAALVGAQLSVDVTAGAGSTVVFTFHNVGALPSSITAVYFDDGTLLGIASVSETAGVDFEQGATPGNLPGGNNASPPFVATAGFTADSEPPTQPNGVNATLLDSERVAITFNLINGQTFNDTIAALENGALRIGIHVQGYLNGASESFVNGPGPGPGPGPGVPDAGSTLALIGLAVTGLGLLRRKLG